MTKRSCCCKTNCCDDIFYTNFIILAGETLDDAAPVDPNDVVVLTMNRPGAGAGAPATIYPSCSGQMNCRCVNCDWMRTYWCKPIPATGSSYCDCSDPQQNCEGLWYSTHPECGPYPG